VGAVLSSPPTWPARSPGFPLWGQPASDALLLLATALSHGLQLAGKLYRGAARANRPMLHALVLGVLGLAVVYFGRRGDVEQRTGFGPHWYPVALILLAIPQCWRAANSTRCSCAHALSAEPKVR